MTYEELQALCQQQQILIQKQAIQIQELTETVRILNETVRDLKELLNRNSNNSSSPPSVNRAFKRREKKRQKQQATKETRCQHGPAALSARASGSLSRSSAYKLLRMRQHQSDPWVYQKSPPDSRPSSH